MVIYRMPLINCERIAMSILNWISYYSKQYRKQSIPIKKADYKAMFKVDKSTHDWDLINELGDKIEVKTTRKKSSYNRNSLPYHTSNQSKQKIMKFLVDDSNLETGIITIKFDLIKKQKNTLISIWRDFLNEHDYKELEGGDRE